MWLHHAYGSVVQNCSEVFRLSQPLRERKKNTDESRIQEVYRTKLTEIRRSF